MQALHDRVAKRGYYGGARLILAICRVFVDHCHFLGVDINTRPGFSLSYETTIPTMLGLSGSSAIICAALDCLLEHFGLTERVDPPTRARLMLAAEASLGITAGLQVRLQGVIACIGAERGVRRRRPESAVQNVRWRPDIGQLHRPIHAI